MVKKMKYVVETALEDVTFIMESRETARDCADKLDSFFKEFGEYLQSDYDPNLPMATVRELES